MVGSGAIGCELLKTFALMGVGVGRKEKTEVGVGEGENKAVGVEEGENKAVGVEEGENKGVGEDNTIISDESSLWKGLDHGGVVLADMDHIERSNLNRSVNKGWRMVFTPTYPSILHLSITP